MRHELKTHPEPFAAVIAGRKRFELRQDDRGFDVGDTLHLREWEATPTRGDPLHGVYTGRAFVVVVTYIVRAPAWALPPSMCVMSIGPVFSEEKLQPTVEVTAGLLLTTARLETSNGSSCEKCTRSTGVSLPMHGTWQWQCPWGDCGHFNISTREARP